MNQKIHIDADIVKLLYYKYKDLLFPLVGFVLSWFFFMQVVLPQIQNFLAVKDEVTANEQTLATLTQNYNTIALINAKDLQDYLDTANRALPQEKDFAGILTAISTAAGLSGVTVNDYSFQVGDINDTIAKGATNQTVQLSLTLNGTIDQTKVFITALSKQLPLSEVTSVTASNTTATTILANFFYDALPKINFIDTNPLPVITTEQKKMLTDLEENAFGGTSAPVSSPSGSLVTPIPQLTTTPISSVSSH